MLSYLFLGANDLEASVGFYKAILPTLGYEVTSFDGKYCFYQPGHPDKLNGPGAIYVAKPYDGQPATAGNGVMPALRAPGRADACVARAGPG